MIDEAMARTLHLPRVLWIELSSRCPFDCIFCTRKGLRGTGDLMDFALYQRLIAQLDKPRILRLNYSGESGHYQRLPQAVALAAETGAQVELVTALASLKPKRLAAALAAGLTRLTVSLHTLDAEVFDDIYRFSSLDSMKERLRQVLRWRDATSGFELDLAFVAMHRNIGELPRVAEFAAANDIGALAVHPVIARDALPMGLGMEHDDLGRLTRDFRDALTASVEEAQRRAPGVLLQLSSHELAEGLMLETQAQPWPGSLPAGARIADCSQGPFETLHVLADGRIVACEVTEKTCLGNLNQQGLRQIWHGPLYQAFRRQHLAGQESICNHCIYKRAYLDESPSTRIDGASAPARQLLRGWHPRDGSNVLWSTAQAAFWLPRHATHRFLRLSGVLAQQWPGPEDGFEVSLNGKRVHCQRGGHGSLNLRLRLPNDHGGQVLVELSCNAATSPRALGNGPDTRELGFALFGAELVP